MNWDFEPWESAEAEQAVEAGKTQPNQELVDTIVANHPIHAYHALRDWPNKGEFEEQLAEHAWQATASLVAAGEDLPDELFEKYRSTITKRVFGNTYATLPVAICWQDARIDAVIELIGSDLDWNNQFYNAGKEMNDNRFKKFKEYIIPAMQRNSHFITLAGLEGDLDTYLNDFLEYDEEVGYNYAPWPASRLPVLEEAILEDRDICHQVHVYWGEKAPESVKEKIHPDFDSYYGSLDEEQRTSFWRAAKDTTVEELVGAPLEALALYATIHQFYEVSHAPYTLMFGIGYSRAKQQNNVQEWAKRTKAWLESYEWEMFEGGLGDLLNFGVVIDGTALQSLDPDVFDKIVQADRYVNSHYEAFFTGMENAVKAGTAAQWAQTIIDYFTENATGGGNYREIFTRDVA